MKGSVRAHALDDSSGISFSLVVCKLSFYCLCVFLDKYSNEVRRNYGALHLPSQYVQR